MDKIYESIMRDNIENEILDMYENKKDIKLYECTKIFLKDLSIEMLKLLYEEHKRWLHLKDTTKFLYLVSFIYDKKEVLK